jgi:hypothetical protein
MFLKSSSKQTLSIIILVLLAAMLVLGGCNPSSDLDAEVREAVKQTRIAQTIVADSKPKELPATFTPEEEEELPTETLSPTPTLSATPEPTLTYTPAAVPVHVSGNTYCRVGTGSTYEGLGVFNIEESSEILAIDPSGDFWLVNNPDAEGECWIWARYATPEASTDLIPVFTPPPNPQFTFQYYKSDCGAGSCWLWFKVENTGVLPMRSYQLTIDSESAWGTGTVQPVSSTVEYDGFMSGSLPINPDLNQVTNGQIAYLHSGQLLNPTGNAATATIKICPQNGLMGICTIQIYNFTISP